MNERVERKLQTVPRIAFGSLGCALLAVVVCAICLRIELLNRNAGGYLPRTDFGDGNGKWRVISQKSVERQAIQTIALQRRANFVKEHPEETPLKIEQLAGPPYSGAELEFLTNAFRMEKARAKLRRWVAGPGLMQYVLAPTALIWSVLIMRHRTTLSRTIGTATASLSIISIALMIYRQYFASLGW